MEEDYSPLLSREPTANINSVLDTTHTVVAYVMHTNSQAFVPLVFKGTERERERERERQRDRETERDRERQRESACVRACVRACVCESVRAR